MGMLCPRGRDMVHGATPPSKNIFFFGGLHASCLGVPSESGLGNGSSMGRCPWQSCKTHQTEAWCMVIPLHGDFIFFSHAPRLGVPKKTVLGIDGYSGWCTRPTCKTDQSETWCMVTHFQRKKKNYCPQATRVGCSLL